MYLTRIDLHPQVRAVRRAMADCRQMHRLLSGLFQSSRQQAGLLYRIRMGQGVTAVYLYSNAPVNRTAFVPGVDFAGERDMTDWLCTLAVGQVRRFDLLAAPMKKVSEEGHKNSRRQLLCGPTERMAWLAREAAQYGFFLLDAEEMEGIRLMGNHTQERGGKMYWDAYHSRSGAEEQIRGINNQLKDLKGEDAR